MAQASQLQAAFNNDGREWLDRRHNTASNICCRGDRPLRVRIRAKSFAKIYPAVKAELQKSAMWTEKHRLG
eukprot:8168051-Pyramimonas_sp.AAC.1